MIPTFTAPAGPVSTITAGELMHTGVISCPRSATAAEIADLMTSHRIHCVTVMSRSLDGHDYPVVWGIVSDLDVLAASTDSGGPSTAEDLAAQPVIQIRSDRPAHEALQAMVTHRVHQLVVVECQRLTPVGILSATDLLAHLYPKEERHV